MQKISFLFLFSFLICTWSFAQKKSDENSRTTDPDSIGTVNSALLPTTMPLLLFDEEKEKEEKKEKKKKARKNIWFGVKTRRGVLVDEFRGQEIVQLFNFTDAEIQPDPYIRDVYWYDPGDKEIKTTGYSKGQGYLLHGPYERLLNEVVVESGMFYYGTKHKTWMLFDSKNVLQDKDHFSEGWPTESRVSYYERESQTIEQITPVQYGLEEGNYYYFYPNGQVAVTGEYQYGEKVGLWTEYWNTGNTKAIRKREIQYQEEAYTKNFRPYIRAEWDQDGNLVYRNDG
ncbi:toxin-antitoxin system YwqK family antitoxin [Algoriphagus namhaensis]